jgi:hypothetical protein
LRLIHFRPHLLLLAVTMLGIHELRAQSLRDADQILKRINQPSSLVCTPKNCDTEIPEFMKDAENPPIVRVKKSANVPAYTRAVVIETQPKNHTALILYQKDGQVRSAIIPQSDILAEGARASVQDEFNAFLSEARFQAGLAQRMAGDHLTPDFRRMIARTQAQLACIERNRSKLSDSSWSDFVRESESDFSTVKGSKAGTIRKFTDEMFEALNPPKKDGNTLKARTLYVPISMDWINSDPELKKYFDDVWIKPM